MYFNLEQEMICTVSNCSGPPNISCIVKAMHGKYSQTRAWSLCSRAQCCCTTYSKWFLCLRGPPASPPIPQAALLCADCCCCCCIKQGCVKQSTQAYLSTEHIPSPAINHLQRPRAAQPPRTTYCLFRRSVTRSLPGLLRIELLYTEHSTKHAIQFKCRKDCEAVACQTKGVCSGQVEFNVLHFFKGCLLLLTLFCYSGLVEFKIII